MTATLYRDAAVADGRGPQCGSASASWSPMGGSSGSGRPTTRGPSTAPADVVDATGSTLVPGLVDGHSHITGPGGAHWIARFADPPDRLLAVAEANGRLASRRRRALVA